MKQVYANKLFLYSAVKAHIKNFSSVPWFCLSPKRYCLAWKSICFSVFAFFFLRKTTSLFPIWLVHINYSYSSSCSSSCWSSCRDSTLHGEPLFPFKIFYFIILFRGSIVGSSNNSIRQSKTFLIYERKWYRDWIN